MVMVGVGCRGRSERVVRERGGVGVGVGFFFLRMRGPPRATRSGSSAGSGVYKRQVIGVAALVGTKDLINSSDYFFATFRTIFFHDSHYFMTV